MICVIYTTFPDKETAIQIGNKLLEEKLMVCSNIFPITSQYNWKDELHEDIEYATYFKTSLLKADDAVKRLLELHPYEIPLITRENKAVNKTYESWMLKELSS